MVGGTARAIARRSYGNASDDTAAAGADTANEHGHASESDQAGDSSETGEHDQA